MQAKYLDGFPLVSFSRGQTLNCIYNDKVINPKTKIISRPFKIPDSHQITFSFTFQLFPRLIQDCRCHTEEWERLKANERHNPRRGMKQLWLSFQWAPEPQVPHSSQLCTLLSNRPKVLKPIPAKPRTSRSTLLTAEPGFMGVAPGRGVSIWPPCGSQRSGVWVSFPMSSLSHNLLNPSLTVSVCQKVSTMGQRWEPTTRWYHSQASGLMGSPTVPSTCKDARLCLGQESGREESSEYH